MNRLVPPRSRLALNTFLAIAAAVGLIGVIATPWILREVENKARKVSSIIQTDTRSWSSSSPFQR